MKRRWQIYGCRGNEGSWSRVTLGLVEGLRQNDHEAHLFATDDVGHDLDQPLPSGYDAPVGIFVGDPGHATMLRTQGNHAERWLMLAPNSTWLPKDAMAELERTQAITGYLTPSPWGKDIIGDYTSLPVRVWMHGVAACTYDAARAAAYHSCANRSGRLKRPSDSWRCLHLSSTQQDRKSTHALVQAFIYAVEADPSGWSLLPQGVAKNARLTVVVDGPLGDIEALVDRTASTTRGRKCIEVASRIDVNPYWMASYMSGFDCVVQPSRAEGFGMVPLEARAAGVPVIMTTGTGHDAHVPRHDEVQSFAGGYVTGDGVVVIRTGHYALIDDGPGAQAPKVDFEALSAALEVACSWRHVLHSWAALSASMVQREWSWQAVTRRFLDEQDMR
jgi:glycosyltransferase involved in cell wall biosynthesis